MGKHLLKYGKELKAHYKRNKMELPTGYYWIQYIDIAIVLLLMLSFTMMLYRVLSKNTNIVEHIIFYFVTFLLYANTIAFARINKVLFTERRVLTYSDMKELFNDRSLMFAAYLGIAIFCHLIFSKRIRVSFI